MLDFGLAKAWIVDADACEMWTASTVTGHATRDGMILGTIGYMSPEQARGQRIDSKADIWAFGCVVFEMLAGRAAFAAETRSDSLARILERDPDWSALPAHTPARIRELLRRCLQKNPATRLGDLAEARTEIDASLASPFRNIQSVLQSVQWWVSRPMVSGALAAVVLIAAIAFVYRLRTVDAPLPQLANPIQVTSAVGVEAAPTFSPDARTIAYESKEAGNWDVWVAQVGGGPPANRTADHNGDDRYPSWSPDGRRIAFWSDRDGGGYYVIPAIGGAAARLIAASGTPFLHSAPEWSADGKRLAAVIYKGPEPRREAFIHIVSMIDRDVREISLTGTEEARLDLSWSPDARYFAYIDAAQPSAEVTELRVVQLSDGQSKALTDGRTNVRRPRWSADGHHLFYVSNRVGPPDLWRQRMADGSPAGEPQRVTTGLELREATFSNAGDRIAYSKGRWVANVWRVPILKDRPATWADAEQVTFDQAFIEFSTVSPDGRLLAYSSDRSGNQDVWVMPFNGEPVQLTNDPAPDWAPRWSYDGRQLAFIHIEQAIGRSG